MSDAKNSFSQKLYKELFDTGKYYEAQQLFMTQVTRKSSPLLAVHAIKEFLSCDSPNGVELASSMGSHMLEITEKILTELHQGQTVVIGDADPVSGLDAADKLAFQIVEALVELTSLFPAVSLKSSNNTKVFFTQAIEFSIKYAENGSPYGHPSIHGCYAKLLHKTEQYPESQHSWAISRLYDDHIVALREALAFYTPKDETPQEDEDEDVEVFNTADVKNNDKTRLIISAVLNYLSVEDIKGANIILEQFVSDVIPDAKPFIRCAVETAKYDNGKAWTKLIRAFSETLLEEEEDAKTEKKKWRLEELAASVGYVLWKIPLPKGMLETLLDASSMFSGFDFGSLLKNFGSMKV